MPVRHQGRWLVATLLTTPKIHANDDVSHLWWDQMASPQLEGNPVTTLTSPYLPKLNSQLFTQSLGYPSQPFDQTPLQSPSRPPIPANTLSIPGLIDYLPYSRSIWWVSQTVSCSTSCSNESQPQPLNPLIVLIPLEPRLHRHRLEH